MNPNSFGKFPADPAPAQPANLPSPAYAMVLYANDHAARISYKCKP